MKERPILFSAPMVRAILAGTKTQTRRIVKPQPAYPDAFLDSEPRMVGAECQWFVKGATQPSNLWHCPHGGPGDRLWVRETWAPFEFTYEEVKPSELPRDARIVYLADQKQRLAGDRYRPSIHMPRWASRITLELSAVRAERLNDISEADAKAEGADLYVPGHGIVSPFEISIDPGYLMYGTYKMGYEWLWESINGADSWAKNSWVWVEGFAVIGGGRK